MKKLMLITAGVLVTVGILITVAVLVLAPLRPVAPVELLLPPMPPPMSPIRTFDVHGTGVLLSRAEADMIVDLTGAAGPAGPAGLDGGLPLEGRMIVRTGEMGLVVEDVEDILSIYDRLSRVRGEIERIKGRMLYLERTAAMSLISVHLEPAAIPGPLVCPGWSPVETLKSAIRGIVIFGQLFGTTAIWLIIFSPVWGAILGIIYHLRRHRRKVKAIL